MSAPAIRRWRGLLALTRDGVVAASRAIERVHLDTARRPFAALALVPLGAPASAVVHTVHDGAVSTVHALIRVTARVAGATLDTALAVVDRVTADGAGAAADLGGDHD